MRLPLLVALGVPLVACAVPSPDPAPENAGSSSTATAVIVVERSTGPGDAVRGDAVIARFVRVKQGSVDDPALRIAGITNDIPSVGTCIVPTETNATMQGRSVELLDVGQVTLSTNDSAKSTVLLPRSMPDPAGVASGVFYSSRAADVFVPSSRVALRSTGGTDVPDGFSATVIAPRDVSDVRTTFVGGALDVSWDATDADAHDIVYVDVLAPRVVTRCSSTDVGRLQVPVNVDEGQVAVHRLHKEAFRAKGIDPGEIRFDVARIVTFKR